MLARRRRPVVPSLALVVALAGVAPAWAQSPEEWRSTREYCVKVLPGKARAYEAFLRDVTVPLNRSRAEAGEFESFAVERAVIPAGSSARCDYRLAYTYKGIPPEEATAEQLDAALKRAGLRLTADQMADQRSALVGLVGVDFWGTIDSAGSEWAKGSYLSVQPLQGQGRAVRRVRPTRQDVEAPRRGAHQGREQAELVARRPVDAPGRCGAIQRHDDRRLSFLGRVDEVGGVVYG